ncbi:unnamed protein product [Durusdinium trenchii]|uniref:Uncharacterized protein n=1 Tax=Durusdinium trenchii TaxID=1381693 RepID=A0ABP0Q3A2_9DINO
MLDLSGEVCGEGCWKSLLVLLAHTRGSDREPKKLPGTIQRPKSKAGERPRLPLEVVNALVQLQSLQEVALEELEGAVARLKAEAPSTVSARSSRSKFQRSFSAIAKPTTEPGGQDHLEDLSAKRSLRRSWTTSMSQAGKLVSAILRPFEDGDTPGNSTVVSAAASEVASDSDTPSLKPSPRDRGAAALIALIQHGFMFLTCILSSFRELVNESKDIKAKSKVSRITFEGSAPLDTLEKQESDSEEEELPQGIRRLRVGSDASSVGRKSDTSSVNWRADALDVGENLAAEAAAKKGHTSIDSIVALVEAERERWDEEKQALEAKLEELKDHLRSMQAQLSPDAEKQALKAQYQELRKAMKARSRFGAWVCERHMIESDDEEPNAEREELRNKISELSTRLRQAKASLGAASSESDVSPSRRSPGIMRHKK